MGNVVGLEERFALARSRGFFVRVDRDYPLRDLLIGDPIHVSFRNPIEGVISDLVALPGGDPWSDVAVVLSRATRPGRWVPTTRLTVDWLYRTAVFRRPGPREAARKDLWISWNLEYHVNLVRARDLDAAESRRAFSGVIGRDFGPTPGDFEWLDSA